ncbi:hypothetical protein ACA910_007629 [Epithemia clementina (nom. ined.)]
MGLTTLPYQATQAAQCMKGLALGNRHDPENVFRWDRVVLNLPGDEAYNTSLSWTRKIWTDGKMAAFVHAYVDDLQETASTEDEAWLAASRLAKAASFFGLQDAARKRCPPCKSPGAWAGALITAEEDGIYKMVSQERWSKLKGHIDLLTKWSEQALIDRKALERTRGFLVYVTLTYSSMTPYLKGLHLMLESWREDRDPEGWRLTPAEWALITQQSDKGEDERCSNSQENAPSLVRPVPRLSQDIEGVAGIDECSCQTWALDSSL